MGTPLVTTLTETSAPLSSSVEPLSSEVFTPPGRDWVGEKDSQIRCTADRIVSNTNDTFKSRQLWPNEISLLFLSQQNTTGYEGGNYLGELPCWGRVALGRGGLMDVLMVFFEASVLTVLTDCQ